MTRELLSNHMQHQFRCIALKVQTSLIIICMTLRYFLLVAAVFLLGAAVFLLGEMRT
jgi:hypothetical protein